MHHLVASGCTISFVTCIASSPCLCFKTFISDRTLQGPDRGPWYAKSFRTVCVWTLRAYLPSTLVPRRGLRFGLDIDQRLNVEELGVGFVDAVEKVSGIAKVGLLVAPRLFYLNFLVFRTHSIYFSFTNIWSMACCKNYRLPSGSLTSIVRFAGRLGPSSSQIVSRTSGYAKNRFFTPRSLSSYLIKPHSRLYLG